MTLGCGVQKPRPVAIEYFPKVQYAAGDRWAKWPSSSSSDGNARRVQSFSPFRWVVLAIFVLSTAINFLDRTTLAQLAVPIRQEFHLSNAQYGLLWTAFYIPYALMAPLAGMLHRPHRPDAGGQPGHRAVVGGGHRHRLFARIGRPDGLPRRAGDWPKPAAFPRRARPSTCICGRPSGSVGNAVNQIAVSLGVILAVPLATALAVWYGWRSAFLVTGALGLAWIPLWNWAACRAPQAAAEPAAAGERGQTAARPAPVDLRRGQRPQHGRLFAVERLDRQLPDDRAPAHAGGGGALHLDSAAGRDGLRVGGRLAFHAAGGARASAGWRRGIACAC